MYVSGTGWRAYDNVIGQPIFYSGFSEKMKNAVVSAPLLQNRISQLADKRLEVEEKEGWLNKDDKDFVTKKAQRRAIIESSIQEVAEKMTNDMICKFESKTFIRGAYYLVTQLLTRAYHQGEYFNDLELLEVCMCHVNQMSRNTCFQRRSFTVEKGGRDSGEEEAEHHLSTFPSIPRRLCFHATNMLPVGFGAARCCCG